MAVALNLHPAIWEAIVGTGWRFNEVRLSR